MINPRKPYYLKMRDVSWLHRGSTIIGNDHCMLRVLWVYRGDSLLKRILRHYDIKTRINEVKVRRV